jgi:hypothetical protein
MHLVDQEHYGTLDGAWYGVPLGVLVGAFWDMHGQGEQDEGNRCVKRHAVPEVPILTHETQIIFGLE